MQIEKLIKQKSYEKILYVLRRHPVTFLPKIGLFIALCLIPVAIFIIVNNLYPEILFGEILFPIVVLATASYYCIMLLFFYSQFIDFYLDMWIVTNDRIVDVEQLGLFARTISELDLFRVEDVTTEIHGFFPTVLNYGMVKVKTASSNKGIIFYDVRDPNTVRETIVHRAEEDKKFHSN